MYRVIAIVGGALALAACSSTPDWMSLDGLKPGPVMDTVRFESEPPGADVKTASGQTCKTPCALALPSDAPQTVTFTLNGYLPETDQLEVIATPGSTPQLRPNPVLAELQPARRARASRPGPELRRSERGQGRQPRAWARRASQPPASWRRACGAPAS